MVIIDQDRTVLEPPGELVVESVRLDTFYDIWGNAMLAQRVGFDKPFSTIPGYILVRKYGSCFDDSATGITMQRSVNDKLVRGGDNLLDNVEDLQFAYGVDTDGNGVIDAWSDDMPDWRGQKWAIRYTLVVSSRPIGGYEYPADSVTVEDHTYALTFDQKKRRRAVLSGVVMPPNLQPLEARYEETSYCRGCRRAGYCLAGCAGHHDRDFDHRFVSRVFDHPGVGCDRWSDAL